MGLRSSVVGVGAALTAVVTGIEYVVWGKVAIASGVSFGLLATVISALAARTLRPGLAGSYQELVQHFAKGLVLRVLGIVVFLVAVLVDRTLFPPLPAAVGYLGVVVPLLFMETKLAT